MRIKSKIANKLRLSKMKDLPGNRALIEEDDEGIPIVDSINKKKKKKSMSDPSTFRKMVALDLYRRFPYSDLVTARDPNINNPVHGYLRMRYPDYMDLIDNQVIDLACLYARRYFKPEMIQVLEHDGILEHYSKSELILRRSHEFDNFPGQPFERVTLFTPRDFEDSFYWQYRTPWSIDGYETPCTVADGHFALLGWVDWNKPAIIVLHAHGKDGLLEEAILSADKIDKEMKLLMQTIIHNLRTIEEPILGKLDEAERENAHWRERYTKLKNKADIMRDEDLDKLEEELMARSRYSGSKKRKISWGTILLYGAIFVGLIVIIFLIVNGAGGGGVVPPNATLSPPPAPA